MTNRFRVWDGEEMHEPPHRFLLGAEGTVHRCSYQCDMAERAVDGKPLFYTGLDDTEGTPIYEGDIVEYWGERGAVEWDEYMPAFTLSGCYFENTGIALTDSTVIGNRYENPDLLERTET